MTIQISKYTKQSAYFTLFQNFYLKKMQKKLLDFNVDLVLYDETEFFREWDDPLFNYPYTSRKNEV